MTVSKDGTMDPFQGGEYSLLENPNLASAAKVTRHLLNSFPKICSRNVIFAKLLNLARTLQFRAINNLQVPLLEGLMTRNQSFHSAIFAQATVGEILHFLSLRPSLMSR